MEGIKIILIIAVIIAGIAGIVFIKKKDNTGIVMTGYIVALIAALAAVLAIPLPPGPGPETDSTISSDPVTETVANTSVVTESTASNEDIEDIVHCHAETEGLVRVYDTFTDYKNNRRNKVLYMGYDGSPSSITIHVNGHYTNISFDFYAVEGIDPEDMARLTFTADNNPSAIHEYAAIPKYNPSGSFDEDITGINEVIITFRSSGTPNEGHPCAILIDNLVLQ